MPYKKIALLFRARKYLSVFVALVCLSAGAAQAKSGMPRSERHESRHEIDQLEETWKDAILKRNVEALDQHSVA